MAGRAFADPSAVPAATEYWHQLLLRIASEQIQQFKTMNTQISFQPDGTAQCLWTEALPLHELGRLEVTRASNIEFNNTTQQWEVKDRRGKVRFIAKSRSACLEWEQTNLQPE